MATPSIETARVFTQTYAKALSNGYKLVTVHLIVRDNKNMFFFVDNEKNETSSTNKLLDYKVIDYDTIVINNYPEQLGESTPQLVFYFSTDTEETTEYKDFELFIQFLTKEVTFGKLALTFQGKRCKSKDLHVTGKLGEKETDKGVIFFPDVD